MSKSARITFGIALLVAIAMAGQSLNLRSARAATNSLSYSQTCQPDANVRVHFFWGGNDLGAVQQWLDLSLFDNGWQPGTFLGAGPFAGAATDFTWSGLVPNERHYVRVNQLLTTGSWDPSATFIVQTLNCRAAPGATAGPTGASATTAAGLPADEQSYRSRAAAQLAYLNAQLAQFYNGNARAFGNVGAILQMCAIAGNFASAVDGLQPVPPRFRAVHDELRDSHRQFQADCMTIGGVSTPAQFLAYIERFDADIDRMNGAIDDYTRVVGIQLQRLRN